MQPCWVLRADLRVEYMNPAALALAKAASWQRVLGGRVLALLVEGKAVAAIAEALGIGKVTVQTHLRSLGEKTGRRSQVDLVRLGLGR